MARICPLFSGSSGNSCFVATPSGGILVDAGVSCKRLMGALCGLHIDPREIKAVLVTHEHTDHIGGLRVFLKKTGAAVFASEAVLNYLCDGGHTPPETKMFIVREGEPFELDGVVVSGFEVPHDSVGPLGYHLTLPDGRTAAYATDMGSVSESAVRALAGADLVMLEANYDPAMLESGPYPYPLKKRVMSARGHLANPDCAHLAAKLVFSGTTRLILAHLSAQNNRPDIALNAVESVLKSQGMKRGIDYMLEVAPRSCPGEMLVY